MSGLVSVINQTTTMTRIDLNHVKVGDTLAIAEHNRWQGTSHRILTVDRITATQVCCCSAENGCGEWRFRKSDGKQIGKDYIYAQIGTPELIAKVKAQVELSRRTSVARGMLDDLEGKYIHQLKLSLEQLEALAMAWTAIKAMTPQQ